MNLLLRKGVRAVGLILPAVYYFTDKKTAMLLAAVLVCLMLWGELLRLRHPRFNEFLIGLFRTIVKEEERTRLTGPTFFMIGAALTIFFFNKEVAIAAILYSVFGDMVATLVGHGFGGMKVISGKTLAGTLSCFGVCAVSGLLLLQTNLELNLLQVLLGAVAATLAEVFSSPFDDNLTIPILSGLLMQSIY